MTVTAYEPGLHLPGKRVIALGFFDGVHLGHRQLLARAAAEAKARGAECAAFTFYAEDEKLKGGTARLYPTADKLLLLEECGVERVIFARLSDIGAMAGEDFVRGVLTEALGCTVAVCGYNFRFGAGASCGAETLRQTMAAAGGDAVVLDEYRSAGEEVSSSGIKCALSHGDAERANRALGKPYFLRGEVTHGRGVGRTLGYPTVNLAFAPGAFLPRAGVYVSRVTAEGVDALALTDIGTCPTFGERETHSETYLLEDGGDLYGKTVTVSLLAYLREEKKFASAEELTEQIRKDVLCARVLNKEGHIR